MIRIALVEDQAMVRGALVALLAMEDDLQVVLDVGMGEELVRRLESTPVDVALLDIELPGDDGIDTARRIRDRWPEIHCIILTTFGRPGYLSAAMEAGAVGFLVKDAPVESLAASIRKVMRGERAIDTDLALAALGIGRNPLTERQQDVLRLTRDGLSIAEIAGALYLTEGTVRNYISGAISCLNARNRADAARIADLNGWLTIN